MKTRRWSITFGLTIVLAVIHSSLGQLFLQHPTPETFKEYTHLDKSMSITTEEERSKLLNYKSHFPSDLDGEPCQDPFPGHKPGHLDYSKICGPVKTKVTSRIIGGENTEPYEFCFQANVFGTVVSNGQKFGYYCGGSVIGEHWVMTAAHCCTGDGVVNPTFWVLIGAYNISDTSEPSRKWLFSNQSYAHPDYDPETVVNDACVIYIEEPITFTPEICPVCYAGPCTAPGQLTTKSLKGKGVTINGHGITIPPVRNQPHGSISDVDRKVTVQVVGMGICQSYFGPSVDSKYYCLSDIDHEKSPCRGDSGSAILVRRHDGYRPYWLAISVVSFSDFNCLGAHGCTKFYVSSVAGWIETVTGIKPMQEKQYNFNPTPYGTCPSPYVGNPLY